MKVLIRNNYLLHKLSLNNCYEASYCNVTEDFFIFYIIHERELITVSMPR